LKFTSKILSEKNTDNELFETFDKIYNEHIEILINDINQLKNIEYYKKYGLKRKKGYLFHGLSGCGKTKSVVAMALYDSRHIIEIPFNILKTHDEFEKIMNLNKINGIDNNNNNIIILFDEIDINNNISNRNNKNINNEIILNTITDVLNDTNKLSQNNKINLGTLLSNLDGISNYNGLIIVATTNYIDKLDPALYRHLRLTPFEFKHLRKIDCINIIKSYFGDYDDFK